jgi:hypothetical protein
LDAGSLLNAYKSLWKEVENQAEYPDDPAVIASFVLRFVYQQLLWNLTPAKMQGNFQRTLGIFGGSSGPSQELCRSFEKASGLALDDFLKIAHVMYGLFKRRASFLCHEFDSALEPHFSPSQISAAEKMLVATRGQFKKYYERHSSLLPLGIPYELNPLLRFPIMLRNDRYWCVYPELINYAATRGLNYYIADAVGGGFSQTFGEAFEEYVCKQLVDCMGSEAVVTEKDERQAGWKGKTNDLTVISGESAILFECKSSGLFSVSKRSASPADLAADIKKNLANAEKGKGLFQLHAKVDAIQRGLIPEPLKIRYASVTKLYSVVLLHDEIWFTNRPEILKNLIDAELKANGIHSFEYQLWHVEELEYLLRAVPARDVVNVVARKFSSPECMSLDLSVFLSTRYKPEPVPIRLFTPNGDSKALRIIRKLAEADVQCPD